MANVIRRVDIKYFTSKDITKNPWNNTTDFAHYDTPAKITTVEAQLAAIEAKYRKMSGDDVVEMTQGEKDAVDAALAADAEQALEDSRDLEVSETDLTRNALYVLLDYVNTLRAACSLGDITEGTFNTDVKDKFEE